MYKHKLYISKEIFSFYCNFHRIIFHQVEYNANRIYKGQTCCFSVSMCHDCLMIFKYQKHFANSIVGHY